MNFLFGLTRKSANILISLSIICIWIFVMLIMSQAPEEEVRDELALALLIYSTLFFGLSTGLIASTIRIIGFIKDRTNFLYNFIAVLNTCLGLFGIILVGLNQLDEPWVLLFMFSLAIGATMMVDIFMKKNVVKPEKEHLDSARCS